MEDYKKVIIIGVLGYMSIIIGVVIILLVTYLIGN